MKNKTTYGVIILCVILTGLTIGFKLHFNDTQSDTNLPKVYVSERYYTEDQLLKNCNLAVTGKITEKKSNNTKKVEAQSTDEASVTAIFTIYSLEVDEYLSGNGSQKIDIVFAGDKPDDIEPGKEYLFFLEEDKIANKTYHLMSYSQGVFEVRDDKYENKNIKMAFKKDEINDKIKKAKSQ